MKIGYLLSRNYEKRRETKHIMMTQVKKRINRVEKIKHGEYSISIKNLSNRSPRAHNFHRRISSSPVFRQTLEEEEKKEINGKESRASQEGGLEDMKETTDDENEFNYFEGNRGLSEFRTVLRSQKRLEELNNDYNRHKGNALIHFAKKANQLYLNPYPTGILRRYTPKTKISPSIHHSLDPPQRQHKHHISIPNYSMGEKYAEVLSGSLKSIRNLKTLELESNRLQNKGTLPILANMPVTIKVLDLSRNNLTVVSYQQIAKIIAHPLCQLIKLLLEKNNGGDLGCKCLAEALLTNDSILQINLSSNNIGDIGAESLGKALKVHSFLKSVLLHWNKIGGQGGSKLFKALSSHDILQVLDLSFNNMGITNGRICAVQLKAMLKKNVSLRHIDISHNSFDLQNSLLIGKGLDKNHTILGIHVLGNQASIDTKGFLHAQRNEIPGLSHIFCRIKPTMETGTVTNKEFHNLQATSNCWICEGWVQTKYEFIPNVTHKYKLGDYDNVYLHLSFEGYKPDLMAEDPNTAHWNLYRMVPPGNINYFYSINNQRVLIDRKLPIQHMKPNDKYIKIEGVGKFTIGNMNQVKAELIKGEVVDRKYMEKMNTIPRPPLLIPKVRERPKTPWTLPISIFWGYKNDNSQLLDNCFEQDWSRTRLHRFIKNVDELEKVKEILRGKYNVIRNSYKQFSGVDPTLGLPSIPVNVSTDLFVHHAESLDTNLVLKDLDLDFIQTTAGAPKGESNNPEKALVRHEYLELIVRLACRKFLSNSIVENHHQAVSKFMDDHIIKAFNKMEFDCNHWRTTYLWNEECDIVLKKHKSLLKALYAQYSGKHTPPGKPKYMTEDEFQEMVIDSNVISDDFGAREISVHFCLAMMTQIDEIDKTKHLEMNELEFIEALSRVAQKLSIVSPYQLEDENFSMPKKEEMQNYGLNVKINNFLETLLKKTMRREFIEHYERDVLDMRNISKRAISKIFQLGTDAIRKVSIMSTEKGERKSSALHT